MRAKYFGIKNGKVVTDEDCLRLLREDVEYADDDEDDGEDGSGRAMSKYKKQSSRKKNRAKRGLTDAEMQVGFSLCPSWFGRRLGLIGWSIGAGCSGGEVTCGIAKGPRSGTITGEPRWWLIMSFSQNTKTVQTRRRHESLDSRMNAVLLMTLMERLFLMFDFHVVNDIKTWVEQMQGRERIVVICKPRSCLHRDALGCCQCLDLRR